jgi:uncharacterized protein
MLHTGIKIAESRTEGKGLVSDAFIPKGEIVWSLDADEKKLTWQELQKLPLERQKLAYQYMDRFIIVSDGSEYMNHSCNPNTWFADDNTLEAKRDIQQGDEVTYDYATAEVDERFRAEWPCKCGAKNCRKTITGKDCLKPEFQKANAGHLPSWVVEFIKRRI